MGRARGLALLAPALAALAFAAAPADAGAAEVPLKIRLVDPAVGGDPQAERVMLQMTVDGQGDQSGNEVRFYGANGALIDTFTIPSAVPSGLAQRTILLGPLGSTPTPDFELAAQDRIDPAGGAVCIVDAVEPDCVAWGSFPPALLAALPDPPILAADLIRGEVGLGRRIDRGCPTWLGPDDDTVNNDFDFKDGVLPPDAPPFTPPEPQPPPPRNNSAAPTETSCLLNTGWNQTPANPTNQTTASFAFGEVPPEYGAHFECRFSPGPSMPGAQAWTSCPPAGNSFPGLTDGFYSFQARAIGYAGTDPSPLHWTWEVDTVPPDTTITQVPPNPSPGFSATFAFVSSEPQSSFVCQFESGPVQTCESPKTLFNLADGPHTFRVWAIDNATNKDPTPATHVFWVDTTLGDLTPPDTALLSRPSNPSHRPTASFTYRSSKPGSAFQCSLDGAPLAPCDPAGISYGRLANGAHTFAVRAIDRAGNVDLTPATYAWRVAAPLPKTRILRAPPGARRIKAKRTRVRFAFRSSPPAARFRCRLNKQRFRACRSPLRLRVGPGRHRFEVFAIDSLGNVEERPVRRIFRVLRRGRGLFG